MAFREAQILLLFFDPLPFFGVAFEDPGCIIQNMIRHTGDVDRPPSTISRQLVALLPRNP